MPQSEPTSLSEALGELGPYPEDHPQTLADLVAADPSTISHPLAWYLRKQAITATRSSDRHRVRDAADTLQMISNGYSLHPWEGAWVCYALSSDRQVVLIPHENGGMRSLRKATRLLPKKDDLPEIPKSAWRGGGKKPAWLVIYGGDPSVLDKPHVARGLATLRRTVPIADICFYVCDPENGTPPTLWSVRERIGSTATGDRAIEFPNPDTLEEVCNYERNQREHQPAS